MGSSPCPSFPTTAMCAAKNMPLSSASISPSSIVKPPVTLVSTIPPTHSTAANRFRSFGF